jgi:hypothetical protein
MSMACNRSARSGVHVIDTDRSTRGESDMPPPVRQSQRAALVAFIALVAAAALLLTVLAASPAAATGRSAADVTRADLRTELLTAAEFAPISTREGWHRVENTRVFDCGALAATRPAQVSVRRSFASDADASGFVSLAHYASRARAKAAFADTKAALRGCEVDSGFLRVKADEPVVAPGQARLIDVFTGQKCCGSDTHLFGVIRQGRFVGIVKLGEMGRPASLDPARSVIRAAAVKLAT